MWILGRVSTYILDPRTGAFTETTYTHVAMSPDGRTLRPPSPRDTSGPPDHAPRRIRRLAELELELRLWPGPALLGNFSPIPP